MSLDYAPVAMRLRSLIPLAFCAVATVASASCAAALAPAAPAVTPAGVRFVMRNREAGSVALAGTFNEWSALSHLLVLTKTPGLWTIVVPLPPGEHQFMYVVDGAYVTPPQ